MLRHKSDVYFFWTGVGILSVLLVFAHAWHRQRSDAPAIELKRHLVKSLGLTDLCLFTDARYTRHPVMADLNTPFQDYPMSLEHFPSGSVMAPPPHLVLVQVDSVRNGKDTVIRRDADAAFAPDPPTPTQTNTHTHTGSAP
jgi:hypothetical protein